MNAPLRTTATPPKPATVSGDLANLPEVFKPYQDRKVWLCWKWVYKPAKKKWDKPPYMADGKRNAKSTDPATWCTYKQALAAVQSGKVDGIGLALHGLNDGEIALDLDDCRDPVSGKIAPWAQQIVDAANSYSEVTVSGTGLRILGCGDIGLQHTNFECDGGRVEVFTAGAGRYITVSGHRLTSCWPGFYDIGNLTKRLLENKGRLHPLEPGGEPEAQPAQRQTAPKVDLGLRPDKERSPYFRNVNSAALAHLDRWVPEILPKAKHYAGQNSWRVSSRDLDRDFEEDLSIHPQGITDWGPRKGLTAIDCVIEFGGAPDALRAADWLCDRCGLDPASLGKKTRQTGGQSARNDEAKTATDEAGLILNSKGQPIANLANVLHLMRTRAEWQGVVALDRLAAKIMVLAPPPDRASRKPNRFKPRQLLDSDIVRAVEWFQLGELPGIRKEAVADALTLIAEERTFDPLEDKLRSLVWDGVPRIDRWLLDYCGAPITERQPEQYLTAVGRCWLISGAARALRPGCKVDSALVMVGPQGIGKSTAGRILAYDWFTDSLPPVHTKDAADHLRGTFIVEFGEMAVSTRAEIEEIKSFITRSEERFRPAYGRFEITYPRRSIFFGTTNRDEFLKDETGNRRFWPVQVTQIDAPRLEADRDQLWAEAVHAFEAGARWHLTDEESRLAAVQQAAYVISDDREDLLARKLAGRRATTTLECCDLLEIRPQGKREQMVVGAMLRSLGWTRISNGRTKIWTAPQATTRASAPDDEDFG